MEDMDSNNENKEFKSSRIRRSIIPEPMPEDAREEINSENENMEWNSEKKDLHKIVKQKYREYIQGLKRLESNHQKNLQIQDIHISNPEDFIDQEDKDFLKEVENSIEMFNRNKKTIEDMQISVELIKKSKINNLATIKLLEESKNYDSRDFEEVDKNSDKVLPTFLT